MIVESRREARRSNAALLATSLRREQWAKNFLLFAGLLFGGRLLEPDAVLKAIAAFAVFCALSSAIYLVNDIWDRDADRRHPLKQTRPIASGEIGVRLAGWSAAILIAGATAVAWVLNSVFGAIATGYVLLLLLYSTTLKHIVILDVLAIAGGFVLRAVAGAVAVTVPIGSWLLVCTTLLALVPGAQQAAPRACPSRRWRTSPSAHPRAVQPLSTRSDDLGCHCFHADCLHSLYLECRNGTAPGHAFSWFHRAVCALRNLPISLFGASETRGGQSGGNAADRPPIAGMRGIMGRYRGPSYVLANRTLTYATRDRGSRDAHTPIIQYAPPESRSCEPGRRPSSRTTGG